MGNFKSDLGLLEPKEHESLEKQMQDVQKMLTGLEKRLSRDATTTATEKGRAARSMKH